MNPVRLSIIFIFTYVISGSSVFAGMPVGARPGGLGDAFVALSDGAIGMYYNPAGLINLKGISSEIFLGEEGFPLIENWGLFYCKRISHNDRIGFSILKQKQDILGKTYRSYQGIIPGVKVISKQIVLGFNLKYLTQKSGSKSYKSKASVDVGLLYNRGFLLIGAVAKNIIDPNMSSFPQNFTLALGLNFEFIQLEVDKSVADYEKFGLDTEYLRVGAEINPIKFLSLRGGWDDTGIEEFVSAGFGIGNGNNSRELSYCYRTERDDLSIGTHWISYLYELF